MSVSLGTGRDAAAVSEHPQLRGPRETQRCRFSVFVLPLRGFSPVKTGSARLSKHRRHLSKKFRIPVNPAVCSKRVLQQFSYSVSAEGSWSNKPVTGPSPGVEALACSTRSEMASKHTSNLIIHLCQCLRRSRHRHLCPAYL